MFNDGSMFILICTLHFALNLYICFEILYSCIVACSNLHNIQRPKWYQNLYPFTAYRAKKHIVLKTVWCQQYQNIKAKVINKVPCAAPDWKICPSLEWTNQSFWCSELSDSLIYSYLFQDFKLGQNFHKFSNWKEASAGG